MQSQDLSNTSQPAANSNIDRYGAIAPASTPATLSRAIAHHASDLIYRYQLRPFLQCQYVNPAVTTILGYKPEDYFVDAELPYTLLHPDDRLPFTTASELLSDLSQGLTLRYRHKNGSLVWLQHWRCPIYDATGQLIAVEGLDRDVTQHHLETQSNRQTTSTRQQIIQQVTEDALRESEEKFRELAEGIRGAFWMTNANGSEVLYISSVYDEIWGFPSQELYQKPRVWIEAIIPEDRERVEAFWQTLPQKSYELEYQITRSDGAQRWIFDRGFAIYSDQGELYRMGGILEDITERKQLELALKQREEEFRALAENLPDVVSRFDREFRHTYVNPAIQHTTGLPPQAFVGKTSRELGMPDELVTSWETQMQQVFATGEEEVSAFRFTTPSGDRYYQSRLVPEFDATGAVVSVLSISRDITQLKQAEAALRQLNEVLEFKVEERTAQLQEVNEQLQAKIRERQQAAIDLRESEEKFRQLAENIQEVFWICELPTFELSYVSPAFQTIWGIPWEAGCQDPQAWLNTIHPEDRERVATAYFEKTHLGLFDEEYRIYRPDGSIRWIRDRGFPVHHEAAPLQRIAGISEDITDYKYAEENIKTSLLEKETLLKEIHHRVKNNLQIVSSLLRLQSRHTHDEQTLELLQESQLRVQSMALIHEQLYETKNLAQLNLKSYVHTLVKNLFYSYNMSLNLVRFQLDIEQLTLQIDTAIPIGLIINELVSNALKYAFPNNQAGEVYVSLTQSSDRIDESNFENFEIVYEARRSLNSAPARHYCLRVKDNGVGLPPSLDFHQRSTLGLHLVCLLTKQLRGCVAVNRHAGTEFRIVFTETL
jgi:PAS domain S-box-containing protein